MLKLCIKNVLKTVNTHYEASGYSINKMHLTCVHKLFNNLDSLKIQHVQNIIENNIPLFRSQ